MSRENRVGRLATWSGQGNHFTQLIVDESEAMKTWNRLKGEPRAEEALCRVHFCGG